MKIKITLDGGAGELDSKVLENPKAVDADDMSEQIIDAIGAWTLSVGDTITIREAA
jgi:hypothetical protein